MKFFQKKKKKKGGIKNKDETQKCWGKTELTTPFFARVRERDSQRSSDLWPSEKRDGEEEEDDNDDGEATATAAAGDDDDEDDGGEGITSDAAMPESEKA